MEIGTLEIVESVLLRKRADRVVVEGSGACDLVRFVGHTRVDGRVARHVQSNTSSSSCSDSASISGPVQTLDMVAVVTELGNVLGATVAS